MQYFLVLTQKCNLNCTYCGNTPDPSVMPVDLDYELPDLQEFLDKDMTDVAIEFYGGEPALNPDIMIKVMNTIDAKAFMLQTNGTVLHKIPAEYHSRFHTVLISIDGCEQTTDKNRGKGTYRRALEGAQLFRDNGFTGDLIARMTMPEGNDVYQEVMHLLNDTSPHFDHVHWQLDAMWDIASPERIQQWQQWMQTSYNPGITKLVNYWIAKMESVHTIPGIAPFFGITNTLLTRIPTKLRCGSGDDFFSITTDGRITFCPILPSIDDGLALVGDIYNDTPDDIRNKVLLDEPCTSCDINWVCGGRCLYTNKTKHWGEEGFVLVCETIRHLVSELERVIPRVQQLIDDGIFSVADFNYPELDNGVEVIP